MSRNPLGWQHQKRRALMPPPQGQPCPCSGCARHVGLCLRPMWPGNADADHVVARILGGHDGPMRWLCRPCNRSKGATLGNQLRGLRRRGIALPTRTAQKPRAEGNWRPPPGGTTDVKNTRQAVPGCLPVSVTHGESP